MTCDDYWGYCRFDVMCQDLIDSELDFSISFNVDRKHMLLQTDKFLIPGTMVIDRDIEDNVCFLPVFRGYDDEAWIFGTHIMKDYYWVFDATDAVDGWRLGWGTRADNLTLDSEATN